MTWRDRLRPASFKGVPFFVKGSTLKVGRRTQVWEFPNRDTPFVQDRGRKARGFDIEAILIGDDYDVARDALIDAFEAEGSGYLVHPNYGDRLVKTVGEASVSETDEEGGMARITVSFVDAGNDFQPIRKRDRKDDARNAATDAASSAADTFEEGFSVDDLGSDIRAEATSLLGDATAALALSRSRINQAVGVVDDVGTQIDRFEDQVESLINSPNQLYQSLAGLVDQVLDTATRVAAGSVTTEDILTSPFASGPLSRTFRADTLMVAYRDLFVFGDDVPTVDGSTPSRSKQQENQTAIIQGFKAATLIETARSVTNVTLESEDQATGIRDEMVAGVDQLSLLADDELFADLQNLRVTLTRYLTDAAEDLPALNDFIPKETEPALVIANRQYGDATRDLEIIERNGLRRPGFVSGGVAIKVLDQ